MVRGGGRVSLSKWRNFEKSIKRAKEACTASGFIETDHFVDVNKMIDLAKGAQRKIADIKLSRYACYLIVMNGDPRNPHSRKKCEIVEERTLEKSSEEIKGQIRNGMCKICTYHF